ncbi:MAG TPA: G1 family glutamic endopeptidase [Acidimicrobiales bacterium]|nr:G1 family glutamic endopeptidase [Acidimicrobiales bacterium]
MARRTAPSVAAAVSLAGLASLVSGGPGSATTTARPATITVAPSTVPGLGGTSSTYPGWSSGNWSGYAQTSSAPYTSVGATWTVPTVSPSESATYSATWAGIDGFDRSKATNDSSAGDSNYPLIQAGTEQDSRYNLTSYAAWWTTSGFRYIEQPTGEPVRPGDVMALTICKVGMGGCQPTPGSTCSSSCWAISLRDVSFPWTFRRTVSYSGTGASVEWIMEAPGTNGSVSTLARYSTFDFDSATANGANPRFSTIDQGRMVQSQASLLGTTATVVSSPSSPDTDTNGFALAYGAKAPAPPKS